SALQRDSSARAAARRLTRLPFFLRYGSLVLLFRRRRRERAAPEVHHLLSTLRHHGRCLTLSGGARVAAGRSHGGIGCAQPHAHERVLLGPRISHLRSSRCVPRLGATSLTPASA